MSVPPVLPVLAGMGGREQAKQGNQSLFSSFYSSMPINPQRYVFLCVCYLRGSSCTVAHTSACVCKQRCFLPKRVVAV